MRIEIRDSGEKRCEACGATALLHSVTSNRALEAELREALLEPSRWNPAKRRRNRAIEKRVDEVGALLRAWTLGA